MARVRILNTSYVCGGLQPLPIFPVPGAWDLETDLEPKFARKTTAHLQQLAFFVPLPRIIPSGWSVAAEPRFIRRRILPSMPFQGWQPTPSVYLTTNAPQSTGNTTIFFASVPVSITVGMEVYDLTTACIPASTQVLSKTGTSVTLTAALTATCNSGDTIFFTYG